MSHTILLCQPTRQKSSRIYSDYDSVDEALEGVCHMYETRLKQANPSVSDIQYDVADLLNFSDSLTDLCIMVYDPSTKHYKPYGKDWVKNKLYTYLKSNIHGRGA